MTASCCAFVKAFASDGGEQGRVIGVAFSCQVVEAVPVEEHDQRVDEVLVVDKT